MKKVILASGSPRRKELLTLAEIDFEVIVSETDERFPEVLSFEEAAIHIAEQKAYAVQKTAGKERIIIAADTIVLCNGMLIGKPKNRENAIEILTMLSGNSHTVITGVCMLKNKKDVLFFDSTTVSFNELSREQIIYYIDKYKPFDKAGAYAIQEWIGAVGIKKISGDFYNVMGLPVNRVVRELEKLWTDQ
jgi:septum formation protein